MNKYLKEIIFLSIKFIIFHLGFYFILRHFFPRNNCAILRYHSIQDPDKNFYTNSTISISPKVFEKHVKYLASHYNIISIDDVVECLKRKIPFPKNSVVFTFDDGYADNYLAYKILKKYSATGTFYITAGYIGQAEHSNKILWLAEVHYLIYNSQKSDFVLYINNHQKIFDISSEQQRVAVIREVTILIKSNTVKMREEILYQLREQLDVDDYNHLCKDIMLNKAQIREMSNSGMTIAGHTMTHANLPNATPMEAELEIKQCKSVLESIIERKVDHFSYPNGGPYSYFSEDIKKRVKKAGFLSSTTSNNQLTSIKSDSYEISRIGVCSKIYKLIYLIDGDRVFSLLRKFFF